MKISDTALLEKTKYVAKEEQLKTVQLLELLAEIERRMLYVHIGYTSLFSYLVGELGYGESEATLRVKAMRLTIKVPEVKDKLAQGTLSLSNAASVQSYAKDEKINNDNIIAVIQQCEGKSTREVKIILDEKRMVVKKEFTIKLSGPAADKFTRLKKIYPDISDNEIIESLIEEKLTKIKLGEQKIEDTLAPDQDQSQNQQQHAQKSVPISVRRTLHARASGQCEHVDSKTKQRCQCRVNLQMDHRFPRAWGGTNEIANLMILCRSHNLARAVKSFGADKMRRTS